MIARSDAAAATPRSKSLAEPKIHETAYVHSFSNVTGDVYIGPNAMISPGTSIHADEGTSFYIGEGADVKDGVVIHGLEQGRVIGDDRNQYSVWIGKNSSITHMALIHGPAFIGDDCFIGFRSTIFNARVGNGCVVMMHALIQDVEIAPGKYVPSGAIVTNQQQADRLPDVQKVDREFARHVMGINDALRSEYLRANDSAGIAPIRDALSSSQTSNGLGNDMSYTNGRTAARGGLNSDVVQQVRQLVAQGYKVGTEHVDQRRFRTGTWKSCSPIDTRSESEAIAALEACMSEHEGEYVRMFGIDPKGKRRVWETIIQRPDGQAPVQSRTRVAATNGQGAATSSSELSADLAEQVRNLLNQGYKVGTEHVDQRRFRTGSWASCGAIASQNVSDVMAAIESNLAEYAGEYVRLIGIDPRAKRRVFETIIQRPDGPVFSGSTSQPASTTTATSGRTSTVTSSKLDPETIEQVRNLLNSGYTIGMEHVDRRRFRTGSWASCSPITTKQESQVIAALEECVANHPGEYVRLIGIEPKAKRRVLETIIQRPDN